MRRLMWTAVVIVVTSLTTAGAQDGGKTTDPDRLYADREHLQSALDAAAIWESRLKANPKDFESAWKLARACYWLGGHVAEDGRRAQYERGIEAGRQASVLEPKRPEGYFWMAANMGAMAESFGLRAGIKYRGPVKKALETVLMLDPGFQQGSADRALGRWYQKVPGLFGGSKDKAVEHLQRSLTYDPARIQPRHTYAVSARILDGRGQLAWVTDTRNELPPPGQSIELRLVQARR